MWNRSLALSLLNAAFAFQVVPRSSQIRGLKVNQRPEWNMHLDIKVLQQACVHERLSSTTQLHKGAHWNENENTETQSKKGNNFVFFESFLVLAGPAVMSALAFYWYPETSKDFHAFVDTASGHTWAAVDGGRYLSDLITPALNGPVASFISLLFGTLTSMTVSTLYERQANMFQATTNLLEDVRLLEIHFQYFPEQYKWPALKLLKEYEAGLAMYFDPNHEPTEDEVHEGQERGRIILEKFFIMFHDISTTKTDEPMSERVLGEAYETINRMFQTRASLISTVESTFPIWHYGNLGVLAAAICTIFLVLTDRTALQFLGGFQLRMCWAMLIGTISMLAAVVYDLTTPLSGVFQVTRSYEPLPLQLSLDYSTREKQTSIPIGTDLKNKVNK